MKHVYIIAVSLLLLAAGCNKDDSTYADNPLPDLVISGLQDNYSAYTHRDTLRIKPVVLQEDLYEFYWTAFTTNFVQGTGQVPKGDTLSKTKDLGYEVLLNPGQYYLVLNVKHKKTGVIKLIRMNLSVSTLTMNGWYLLKDDGTKTDFDFIYPTGRINNWIAFYNNGKSLEGTAVKAVFTPSFKLSVSSTDLFNTLFVLSDKDAVFCRIDNGKIVKSFDDMFFTKPATRKLQNAFQPTITGNIGVINDNQVYNMSKGALFSGFPPSTYRISPIVSVAALSVGFDDNSKSIISYDGAAYVPLQSNGNELKNMNADLIWMNGYAGNRSIVLSLFRKPSGEGTLIKINAQYGYLGSTTTPVIAAKQTVPASHGLMNASARGGNYDADFIYYSVENNIYRTDIATISENLQVTLPAGETVTCIQHIKYPQPASSSVINTLDYLAIASYANGRYKVWLHKISSTGTIQALAKPDFEGDGRVSNITYMEQGMGSRVF